MAWHRWIWCEDTVTGHRMDLPADRAKALANAGQVRIVEGYPINEGPNIGPRPAKPRRAIAEPPEPAGSETDADTAAGPEAAASDPATKDAGRKPRKTTATAAQPAEPTTTHEGID